MKERRRRREIARYFDKFQRTSTLTFLYDLLTGLQREREREREREGWEGGREREELRDNFGLRGNNQLDTGIYYEHEGS